MGDKRCVFDRVMFFPELDKLDDEMDVLITPKELVSDKGIDWQTFVDEDVPLIKIRKENVTDVNTDGFEDMQEKLELITAELNRKDAEWKRERIEIEKKRNEEMRNLKEKMEIRRKIELQREKTTKRIEIEKMEQVHQMNRQDDTLKIQVLEKSAKDRILWDWKESRKQTIEKLEELAKFIQDSNNKKKINIGASAVGATGSVLATVGGVLTLTGVGAVAGIPLLAVGGGMGLMSGGFKLTKQLANSKSTPFNAVHRAIENDKKFEVKDGQLKSLDEYMLVAAITSFYVW